MSYEGFPTELLLLIIDKIEEDEDLLLLARASRLLHFLCMKEYFHRIGFDPVSKSLHLNSQNGTLKNLAGLAISLDAVGTCLDYLSYDFGYINHQAQLVQEVRLLIQFIRKLKSIDKVYLRLATHYETTGNPSQWRARSIILLRDVLQRSCKNIHITTSQLSSFSEEPKSLRSPRPGDWLKNYWPDGVKPDTKGTKHLKVLSIQTFPTFLRPFYFHALETNASVLTELSFKNIFGGGNDWGLMMANLQFPKLARLAVNYGVIPRDPMIKFLVRHPSIVDLEYHHIRYEPRPKHPARMSKTNALECVHTLTTSPEHILNFLPPLNKLPALTSITIIIQELVTNFSSLDGALRCLTACTNKITLALEITRTGLGFGAWLDMIVHTGLAGRPELLLSCVETLVMDNGDWGFTDDEIISRLPTWLRLFPALRMLTLKHAGAGARYGSSVDESGVLSALKEECPGVYIEWQQKGTQPHTLSSAH
ncbi:hypothetical protein CPC08DRAFT_23496 [Agrocybe pediades]|nr:hypothetical protein CPC08DRAFT_23496 [Agrocybe pediades]